MSSGFVYLKEDIKKEIQKLAKSSLQETSIKDPPVKIKPLYDSKHLQRQLFDKEDENFIELSKSIGVKKAEFLRGVLFVDKSIVVARDDVVNTVGRVIAIHHSNHRNPQLTRFLNSNFFMADINDE